MKIGIILETNLNIFKKTINMFFVRSYSQELRYGEQDSI